MDADSLTIYRMIRENGPWFEVDFRPESQEQTTFEADLWDLERYQELDFQIGKPIEKWIGSGWFGASGREIEGPLEDVLKTSNLLPVVSQRVKIALEAAIISGIQFLPVRIFDSKRECVGTYFLANVLNVLPALDYEESTVKRTSIKERNGTEKEWISWISRTVLCAPMLEGYDVIKLPGYYYALYVSARFKRVFNSQAFTGIAFREVELSTRTHPEI